MEWLRDGALIGEVDFVCAGWDQPPTHALPVDVLLTPCCPPARLCRRRRWPGAEANASDRADGGAGTGAAAEADPWRELSCLDLGHNASGGIWKPSGDECALPALAAALSCEESPADEAWAGLRSSLADLLAASQDRRVPLGFASGSPTRLADEMGLLPGLLSPMRNAAGDFFDAGRISLRSRPWGNASIALWSCLAPRRQRCIRHCVVGAAALSGLRAAEQEAPWSVPGARPSMYGRLPELRLLGRWAPRAFELPLSLVARVPWLLLVRSGWPLFGALHALEEVFCASTSCLPICDGRAAGALSRHPLLQLHVRRVLSLPAASTTSVGGGAAYGYSFAAR